MNRRIMSSVVAAVVACAFGAIQANAAAILNYDLRFVSGPTAPTDSHTVTSPAAGDYTVQLWAQLTGNDTNHTNDTITTTLTNIQSTQVGGGAFAGASTSPNGTGVTASAINTSTFQSSTAATASNDTADQVDDWGSASTAAVTNWQLIQNSTAIAGGGSVGEAVDQNTWEFLLATLTIHVSGLTTTPGGETDFAVGVPAVAGVFAYSGLNKTHPVIATIDGTNISANSSITSSTLRFVNPSAIPEPASMGMLALGGMALLARRRKRA